MSPEQFSGILPLVLIVLVFWLLVIRPARKKQQEMNRIQAIVEVGAEVMLGSGIYGTVVAVRPDTIDLEVSPGATLKVARQAVVRVLEPTDEAEPADGSPNAADEQ